MDNSQNDILTRIADILDVIAMGQSTLIKIMEESTEPLLVVSGHIPQFPKDPLEGFPSIRKEDK